MGMGVASGGGGGGRRRRRKRSAIMSEINVTPMVDVMLVLLIIHDGGGTNADFGCAR